jgi:hypothetical protein
MKRTFLWCGIALLLCGQQTASAQVFPSERLAGPPGTAGNWGVIDYFGGFTATAPASNVILQILDIESGAIDAETAVADYPWLDITDPDTNGSGGGSVNNTIANGGLYTYPSDEPGVDDDDIISIAHGTIRVTQPGDYTFNVHSDDGFAFRIFGAQFTAVQGNGELDADSADTILHPADTGDSSTQAVVNLQAGTYDLEFMTWERAGGAFYELSAAQGNWLGGPFAKLPQWMTVGDPRTLPERTVFPTAGLGQLKAPLDIYVLEGTSSGNGLEALRLDLLDAISDGSFDYESHDGETFVLDDHNPAPAGCPFGVFPHDGNVVQFPNTTGNVDNFSTAILGSFVIDDGDASAGEALTISVHVDSDDRSMFHIIGESFSDVMSTDAGIAAQLFEIDGDDVMFADQDTCNTQMTGLIDLTEGVTYNFEAIHAEAGGDAGMQILLAVGDYLGDNDPDAFSVLSMPGGAGVNYAANQGFTLVAEGGGVVGDFNGNGSLDLPDIDDLTTQSAGGTNPAAYDLTGDALVNEGDVNEWVSVLFNSWMGDADLNGEFNSSDLVTVLASGTYETDVPSVWSTGDFNGDGRTNSSDLVSALAGGGYEAGPRAAVAAVPEPTSLVLVVIGLMAAISSIRRRAN